MAKKPTFVKTLIIPAIATAAVDGVAFKTIKSRCLIILDGCYSYKRLTKKVYRNKLKKFNTKNDPEHFQRMHTIISNTKSSIQVTIYRIYRKNLQTYLHEFCYRFSILSHYDKEFKQLLYTCIMGKPTAYCKILCYEKLVLNIAAP